MPNAAVTIGQALAGLGRAPAADDAGDAAAPSSREAIFTLVERSPEPLTIEQICQASGLHANTVRTHLDVLHAAGRVEREQGTPKGRGRPPWLYRVAPGERSAQAVLAETLLDQLDAAFDPGLTRAAAQRWATAVRGELERQTPAADPDDAVGRAATALEHLGFDARVDGVGDRIELRGCPYAALVAERPVICDIHAALLVELLRGSGQPVTLRGLDVWTRRGLCVARLDRPDLRPSRSIAPPEAVAEPGHEDIALAHVTPDHVTSADATPADVTPARPPTPGPVPPSPATHEAPHEPTPDDATRHEPTSPHPTPRSPRT